MDKEFVVLCVCFLGFLFLVSTTKKDPPKAVDTPATVIDIKAQVTKDKDGVTTSKECVVTFQLESKKEVSLKVPDGAYAFIKRGDKGRLTYEGDKFKNFERT